MAQDFNWSLLGLNRHRFTAYANLLALRNGGQVEPASLGNDKIEKDESNDDSDEVSIDTSRPNRISDSGHHPLKEKFLDCLAELAANKRGGKSVACSGMMEGEETVTLWITRNEGFQIPDNIFFEKLSERLSGLLSRKDEIRVEDIHKWQVEGSLVANIINYFCQMPEASRGGYFPWFLKHTDILEKPWTKQESTEKLIATFHDQARFYLDKEDQHKKPNELKPNAKGHCFQLLAAALHMAYPNPSEQNWYNFGFSTCYDESQERKLGGLYQRLLLGSQLYEDVPNNYPILSPQTDQPQTASFGEFWHAFESGSLIQLMDSKDLKKMRLEFPFLEGFLSVPPCGPHPSVWYLKQFIAINNPNKFPPTRALEVDYGFMNCRTSEETCILMEIYKRLLLKANPLELHKACLAGELFEFARKFHQMDEGHRRLMRNIYPLTGEGFISSR